MSPASKHLKDYDYKKISIFLNKLKKKIIQKTLKNKKIKFYLPSIFKLKSKVHQKLQNYFRKNLVEYKKVKILYGLYRIFTLKNFIKKQLKNKNNKYRFLKENDICCLFEKRVDVFLYRSHFLNSLSEAKQVINHGKIYINGQKIRNFSFSLKKGEILSLETRFKNFLNLNIKKQIAAKLLKLTKNSICEIDWLSFKIIFIKLRTYIPENLFLFTSLVNWDVIITNLKSN